MDTIYKIKLIITLSTHIRHLYFQSNNVNNLLQTLFILVNG